MPEQFERMRQGVGDMGVDAVAVTPSDDNDLPGGMARAIWTGSGGAIRITTRRGNVATFGNVPAGEILAMWCRRVHASGTDATGILAIY